MPEQPLREQTGAAMLSVVLVSALSALIAATAFSSAVSTLGQSGNRRRHEAALHLAQAGAGRALGLIGADNEYDTATAPPASAARAWAIAAAAALPVERAREGEFAWVVPTSGAAVYGVGYVPDRATSKSVRVVQVEYDLIHMASPRAVLAQGSVAITGNPSIEGTGASIHTNADLSISGNPTVDQNATASGGYTQTGNPQIGGQSGGGFPAVPIETVAPASFRSLTEYDLCPDATVRQNAAAVCTGTLLGTGLASGWNGWKWNGTDWRMTGNSPPDGGYYVYRGGVELAGSPGSDSDPWLATIVVEGLRVGSALVSGDLRVTGNPSMRAWKQGVALVAERDLHVSGGLNSEGLVLAGEQIELAGNGTFIGSFIAAGSDDTVGSPVAANRLTGNFTVRAEFGAPSVSGGVQTVRWTEL